MTFIRFVRGMDIDRMVTHSPYIVNMDHVGSILVTKGFDDYRLLFSSSSDLRFVPVYLAAGTASWQEVEALLERLFALVESHVDHVSTPLWSPADTEPPPIAKSQPRDRRSVSMPKT
ncbi:hypothetical protein ITJ38_18000 [Agreia pratensis]|uniref:hypothetical protein n=1 Tax=Agreia pratensis TaxID=150121 RepID=UPI00188D0F0E|nr:hypothetical protein [Agreia pratensis]MBF4636307.1 hypothetical protein [Agreia pratensis]